MKTPIESILLVIFGTVIGSFGAVFLKSGASKIQGGIMSLVLNWRLGAGIAAYLISSYFFVMGVKHGELTVLYPMVSLGNIWTLFWSRLFFKEPLTKNKFFGLSMILTGAFFLSVGK